MKKNFVVSVVISCILIICFCGEIEAKTRGLASLRIGLGGRAVGMGEAFTAVSRGAVSTYWNPAGLVGTNGNELLTAHNRWLFDVSSEFIAFAWKKWDLAFGLSFNYTDAGKIEARTFRNESEPIGYFSANDAVFGLSLAKKIKRNLEAGVTIKYLYEKIYIESTSGIAFDIGINYHLLENNLTASLTVRNFGIMNKMRNEKLSLPVLYRAGIMYDVSRFFNKNDFLFISSDYEILPDYNNHLLFGAELKVRSDFALRLGYQNGYSERNLCGGMGFVFGFLKLDYGFTPFSSELGNTHRFSLGFNW